MATSSGELRNAAWLKDLDSRLLAAGVPCGSYQAPDQSSKSGMHIRYKGQFIPVSKAGFSAWWQLLRPRTPHEICDWIEQGRLGPGVDTVTELHDAGLLLNWTGDPVSDMPTIAPHRLLPFGIGMGANAENPQKCTLTYGFVGKDVVIDPVAYTAWAACDGKTALGEACRRAGAALELLVDEVWEHVHKALPEIMGGGMALLDR